jgi:hypothetical protein
VSDLGELLLCGRWRRRREGEGRWHATSRRRPPLLFVIVGEGRVRSDQASVGLRERCAPPPDVPPATMLLLRMCRPPLCSSAGVDEERERPRGHSEPTEERVVRATLRCPPIQLVIVEEG